VTCCRVVLRAFVTCVQRVRALMPVMGGAAGSPRETFCGVNARWRLFKCVALLRNHSVACIIDIVLQIQPWSSVRMLVSAHAATLALTPRPHRYSYRPHIDGSWPGVNIL
jgi:hypothetical protein